MIRNDDRPIFIGGAPRSGTTLLRTMLHSHPDVAIPRETLFLMEAVKRRREWGNLRKKVNRAALVDWIVTGADSRFGRLGIDQQTARARLLAAPPTLGSVLGTAYVLYAEQHGAVRWGDKRPAYSLRLPVLLALFPDLQYVGMVRDPRAVIASMRRLGWLDSWYDGSVVGGLDRWMRSVHAGLRARARYRHDQFFEFRYEDLVAEPGERLAELCAYLTLDAQHLDAMLAFHERAREIPRRQRRRFHSMLDRPVTAAAADRWRDDLDAREVAFIERAAAREMERWGYEPVARGVTVPADFLRQWGGMRRRRMRQALKPRPPMRARRVAARLTSRQQRMALGRAGE